MRRLGTVSLVVALLSGISVVVSQASASAMDGVSQPPPAVMGQAYAYQLQVAGNPGVPPYAFELQPYVAPSGYANGLPQGLSMSAQGLISGTPTFAEQTQFSLVVVDSANDVVAQSAVTMMVGSGNTTVDPALVPLGTQLAIDAGLLSSTEGQVTGLEGQLLFLVGEYQGLGEALLCSVEAIVLGTPLSTCIAG